jgi:hypothetical protein
MPNIEDYQIDMRNWHPLFALGKLKQQLDTKVQSKEEFSMVKRSLALASQEIGIKSTVFNKK